MNVQPFVLGAANTLTLAVTAASAGMTVPGAFIGANVVQVYNSGTATAYLRATVGASTAVVPTASVLGDTPIPSGVVIVFTKGLADTLTAIGAGATSLSFTFGEGQ